MRPPRNAVCDGEQTKERAARARSPLARSLARLPVERGSERRDLHGGEREGGGESKSYRTDLTDRTCRLGCDLTRTDGSDAVNALIQAIEGVAFVSLWRSGEHAKKNTISIRILLLPVHAENISSFRAWKNLTFAAVKGLVLYASVTASYRPPARH